MIYLWVKDVKVKDVLNLFYYTVLYCIVFYILFIVLYFILFEVEILLFYYIFCFIPYVYSHPLANETAKIYLLLLQQFYNLLGLKKYDNLSKIN